LNLRRLYRDISKGRDFDQALGELDMPKADVRVSNAISATTASEKSESHPLVMIALFSGIGLLASMIAILAGIPGAWY
jgi:hypothetical protein